MNKSYLIPTIIFLSLNIISACSTDNNASYVAQNKDAQTSVKQYGEWAFGCNNHRICTAIAPLEGNFSSSENAHITLKFDTDSDEIIATDIWHEKETAHTEIEFSKVQLEELTHDLEAAIPFEIRFQATDNIFYVIPKAGYSEIKSALAQFRAMPAQHIVSTVPFTPDKVTQIVDIGENPFFKGKAQDCPDGHIGESLQAWQSVKGKVLWRFGCGNEGLNPISFWYESETYNSEPQPIDFSDSVKKIEAYNSWFDEHSSLLRITHYFGAYRDCGIYRIYGWDNEGIKLIEQNNLPICGAEIEPDDWINIFKY